MSGKHSVASNLIVLGFASLVLTCLLVPASAQTSGGGPLEDRAASCGEISSSCGTCGWRPPGEHSGPPGSHPPHRRRVRVLAGADDDEAEEVLAPHVAQFEAEAGNVEVDVSYIEEDVAIEALETDLGNEAEAGERLYDAYVITGTEWQKYADWGYLQPLTQAIAEPASPYAAAVQWEDILPSIRTTQTSWSGEIYAMPLDLDYVSGMYNVEVFQRFGRPLPQTLEELVEAATYFHGRDLNGDGTPDWGANIKTNKISRYLYMFLAPLMLSRGAAQGSAGGVFFDVESMEPLLENEAFREATRMFTALFRAAGFNDTETQAHRSDFIAGRAAMYIGLPGSLKQISLSANSSKFKRFLVPGSERVLDAATGALAPCTPAICPHMTVQGTNQVPYFQDGWHVVFRNQSVATPRFQDAFDLFAYIISPEKSIEDVVIKAATDIYRLSHIADGVYERHYRGAGWTPEAYQDMADTFGKMRDLEALLDLRVEQKNDYMAALNKHMGEYLQAALVDPLPDLAQAHPRQQAAEDTFVASLHAAWEVITERIGRSKSLDQFRRSLGLPPLSLVRDCPPGHYLASSGEGKAVCVRCPADHYKAGTNNATSCNQCPANSQTASNEAIDNLALSDTSSLPAATSARDCRCVRDYFTDDEADVDGHLTRTCRPCPKGARCYGGSKVVGEKDWYRPNSNETLLYKCHPGRCTGEQQPYQGPGCAEGHTGMLCGTCLDDFAMGTGSVCKRCEDVSAGTWVLIALVAITVLTLLIFFCWWPVIDYHTKKAKRLAQLPQSVTVAEANDDADEDNDQDYDHRSVRSSSGTSRSSASPRVSSDRSRSAVAAPVAAEILKSESREASYTVTLFQDPAAAGSTPAPAAQHAHSPADLQMVRLEEGLRPEEGEASGEAPGGGGEGLAKPRGRSVGFAPDTKPGSPQPPRDRAENGVKSPPKGAGAKDSSGRGDESVGRRTPEAMSREGSQKSEMSRSTTLSRAPSFLAMDLEAAVGVMATEGALLAELGPATAGDVGALGNKYMAQDILAARQSEGLRAFFVKASPWEYVVAVSELLGAEMDQLVNIGLSSLTLVSEIALQSISFVQMLHCFNSIYDIDWPDSFTRYFHWAHLANIDIDAIPAIGCIVDMDVFQEFLLWVLGPLALVLLLALLYATCPLVCGLRSVVAVALFKTAIFKSVIFALFLLYIPVSMQIFRMFSCKEVYGAWHLTADMEVECFTPKHNSYLVLAAIALVVYPLGVPAAYVAILRGFKLPAVVERKRQQALLHQVAAAYGTKWLMNVPDHTMLEHVAEGDVDQLHRALCVSERGAARILNAQTVKASMKMYHQARALAEDSPGTNADSMFSINNHQTLQRLITRPVLEGLLQYDGNGDDDDDDDEWASTGTDEKTRAQEAGLLSREDKLAELLDIAARTQAAHDLHTSWNAYAGIPWGDLNQVQCKEKSAIVSCAFLFAAYKPEYWWFEVAECAKKVFLTSAVLLIEDGPSQILAACCCSGIMILVYALLRPVSSTLSQTLKLAFTTVIYINLFIGMGMQSGSIARDSAFWQLILIVLNLFMIIVPGLVGFALLGYTLYMARRRRRNASKQDGDLDADEQDMDADVDFLSGD